MNFFDKVNIHSMNKDGTVNVFKDGVFIPQVRPEDYGLPVQVFASPRESRRLVAKARPILSSQAGRVGGGEVCPGDSAGKPRITGFITDPVRGNEIALFRYVFCPGGLTTDSGEPTVIDGFGRYQTVARVYDENTNNERVVNFDYPYLSQPSSGPKSWDFTATVAIPFDPPNGGTYDLEITVFDRVNSNLLVSNRVPFTVTEDTQAPFCPGPAGTPFDLFQSSGFVFHAVGFTRFFDFSFCPASLIGYQFDWEVEYPTVTRNQPMTFIDKPSGTPEDWEFEGSIVFANFGIPALPDTAPVTFRVRATRVSDGNEVFSNPLTVQVGRLP